MGEKSKKKRFGLILTNNATSLFDNVSFSNQRENVQKNGEGKQKADSQLDN